MPDATSGPVTQTANEFAVKMEEKCQEPFPLSESGSRRLEAVRRISPARHGDFRPRKRPEREDQPRVPNSSATEEVP